MDKEKDEFPCRCFSVNEIKALCDKEVKFKRALECIQGMQNHTLNVEDDAKEVKVECKCSGTSHANYQLSIKLNKESKRLMFANCSCPYKAKFSKREELCKHTIALLLKHFCFDFIDDKNVIALSTNSTRPQPATQITKKVHIDNDKKRLLPTWMKNKHKSLESKRSSESKRRKSIVPIAKQARMKSKKQRSNIKRTVYLMTPEELLETAHEILKESKSPEKPKKRKTENLPLETEKTKETFTSNKADKEFSAPNDVTRENYGIEVKTLLLDRESQERGYYEVASDDDKEGHELQWCSSNKIDDKQEELIENCPDFVKNEEYYILDELM